MKKLLRRLGAGLAAAALAVTALAASPAPAATAREACLRAGNAWVVVENGSSVQTGCGSDLSNGFAALRSAGFKLEVKDGFLEQINGAPATPDRFKNYWSYWSARPNQGGDFTGYIYSQVGGGISKPQPGSVEVWRFLSLRVQPGDAAARPVTALPPNAPAPTLFGDQDGNGQADLLATDTAGALRMYSVRGQRLSAPYILGRGWSTYNWVTTVPDLNGDRKAELLGRRTDGTMWLLTGKGDGYFNAGIRVGTGWSGMSMLTVLDDINGDRLPDMVGRASDGRLILYSFNSKGILSSKGTIGWRWNGIRLTTTVGDFSGDGIPDLLAVASDGRLMRYSFARTGKIVATAQVGRGWDGMGLIASPGDVNRDGRRDLLALDQTGVVRAYHNLAPGRWGVVVLGSGVTRITNLA